MATCPDCGGHLHSRHRCRGLWRLRLALAADLLIAAMVGAVIATAGFFFVDGQVAPLTIPLGALIGLILRWSLIQGQPPHFKAGA